jgi:hypothetical protein
MAAVAIGGSSTGGLLGSLRLPPYHSGVLERPTRKHYVMPPPMWYFELLNQCIKESFHFEIGRESVQSVINNHPDLLKKLQKKRGCALILETEEILLRNT